MTRETGEELPEGTLYVVATPIGNLEDITLRALRILGGVDLVACEDTRHTGKLLAHHGIRTRLISFHEHNEPQRTPELISRLKAGERVALVSDAGTPLVSDPGYRLVSAAVSEGFAVVAVPGPSSLTAALSVSGLPTDAFVFAGFLARKKEKRTRQLMQLQPADKTLILFESPRRILSLLSEIAVIMGDRRAVLCRELTKRHEECLRGRLSEIRAALCERSVVKGECTLLVAAAEREKTAGDDLVEAEIRAWLRSGKAGTGAMAREISRRLGVSKSSVYEKAVRIQREEKN